MDKLQKLQEDLKYYEDFIFELSKYDRQFAHRLTEALAVKDPEAIAIIENAMQETLNEGIGTAMERGAQLGTKVAGGLGFKGRVSDFLMLKTPFKAIGGAIGAGAHLMGADVGGSRSGVKPGEAQPQQQAQATQQPVNIDVSPVIKVSPKFQDIGTQLAGRRSGIQKNTQDRTDTNLAAADTSGDADKVAAATAPKWRNRLSAMADRTADLIDSGAAKVKQKLADRSAKKISAETGKETSGDTVSAAADLMSKVKEAGGAFAGDSSNSTGPVRRDPLKPSTQTQQKTTTPTETQTQQKTTTPTETQTQQKTTTPTPSTDISSGGLSISQAEADAAEKDLRSQQAGQPGGPLDLARKARDKRVQKAEADRRFADAEFQARKQREKDAADWEAGIINK